MTVAYVDTSCLVAIAFDENGADCVSEQLEACDRLLASNLLEAELAAAFRREDIQVDGGLTSWITWFYPNRPLTSEYQRVLAKGYVRGADLWHLGCALFISPNPMELGFFTLDQRQNEVAVALGFHTL